MRCLKVRSLLSAYSNGELKDSVQLSVSEHLTGCAECRQSAAVYRTLFETRPQLPTKSVSADFNNKLLNRIAHERFAETRSRAWLPLTEVPSFFMRRVAPVFVTASLVFAVAIIYTPKIENTPEVIFASYETSMLDDSYLTAQPNANPNMLANQMRHGRTIAHMVASTQRTARLTSMMLAPESFAGDGFSSLASSGAPSTFAESFYRLRPIVRMYVAPQGASRSTEVNATY
jgi:Putative zinc-finger